MESIKYYFEDGDKEHCLVCEIDYTPYSRGSFERGGLQIEPDEPESIEVYSAKLNGIDIISLLSDEVVGSIDQMALEQIHEKRQEHEP